jgi:hypothetical protein
MTNSLELHLPIICKDGGHLWVRGFSEHGCGYSSGDHAAGESLVIATSVGGTREVRSGDLCNICGLVFGTVDTRSLAWIAALNQAISNSW